MPSRTDVPEYAEYLEKIEALVAVVNHRHGTPDWMPIDLKLRDDLEEAVASYKHYDVMMVNAMFDGMNLVAKEGPLVNERDGVSILSENTGAHEELGEFALSVNPFDVQELADSIYAALTMAPESAGAAPQGLKEILTSRDPGDWIDEQIADIRAKARGRPRRRSSLAAALSAPPRTRTRVCAGPGSRSRRGRGAPGRRAAAGGVRLRPGCRARAGRPGAAPPRRPPLAFPAPLPARAGRPAAAAAVPAARSAPRAAGGACAAPPRRSARLAPAGRAARGRRGTARRRRGAARPPRRSRPATAATRRRDPTFPQRTRARHRGSMQSPRRCGPADSPPLLPCAAAWPQTPPIYDLILLLDTTPTRAPRQDRRDVETLIDRHGGSLVGRHDWGVRATRVTRCTSTARPTTT